MPKLNQLTAVQALDGLKQGKFRAEQLMRDCLDQIESREEEIRAWTYIDPEYALEHAQAADKLKESGRTLGSLHGLPIGVKDVIDTADMPTENGSPIHKNRRPDKDALCIAALKSAGAIIIGKTVTTEFANANPSKTRNPHNLEHSPGGSSAGSAAGIADHHMPLALGTQTGGSVIRPASFNGVYGFKPTLGLIPRSGVLLQSHSLDTVGVYSRSLQDLAVVTDCMSMPDPNDPESYLGSRSTLTTELDQISEKPPSFAFLETPAWAETDNSSRNAIIKATEILGDVCKKKNLPKPFDEILDLHATVFAAENAYYYGNFLRTKPDLLSSILRDRLDATKDTLARDYIAALQNKKIIYEAFSSLLDDFDAVICLSSTGPAPLGFSTTGSPAFNSPWTYLGVPCISLPKLNVSGLPLGLQIVGKRGEDGKLLRTAHWLDNYFSENK